MHFISVKSTTFTVSLFKAGSLAVNERVRSYPCVSYCELINFLYACIHRGVSQMGSYFAVKCTEYIICRL